MIAHYNQVLSDEVDDLLQAQLCEHNLGHDGHKDAWLLAYEAYHLFAESVNIHQ